MAHTLHAVADVLNRHHIGEVGVQFVNRCHRVALAEQLIAHVRQHVEQHRILQLLVCLHDTFYAETEEFSIPDVRVTVEIFALRALTK